MRHRWLLRPLAASPTHELARDLLISPLLAQCLANRGICTQTQAETFLSPRLRLLRDPLQIPHMNDAIERLWIARRQGESVTIFGDYDVDGVTATAILLEVFQHLGLRASAYLPNRLEEGYGLSQEAVENCIRRHPTSLLIAVDCGSTSNATIDWLQAQGIDVVVLDHHQVSLPLPEPRAFVNPQLSPPSSDNDQPATELCSAGLAFKLAHALVKHARLAHVPEALDYDLRPLLDLVVLGTVADLVPLRGENRALVAAGLRRLDDTARPGLQALKSVAQTVSPLDVRAVGYLLGPRLNAAGRLETATHALELLRSTSLSEATLIAQALDRQNRERQTIERAIAEEAISIVRTSFDPQSDYVIVEGQPLWHIGVVGIVASRVLREFHRPTLILGGDADHLRGSGRSVEGFDLAAALRACADLLEKHGGHAMAAGLAIRPQNLPSLKQRLNQLARQILTTDQLQPRLQIDATVSLSVITPDAITELDRLQPIGQGNPPVQLVACGLRFQRPPQRIGREGQHLRLWVTDGHHTLEAVWWNGARDELPPTRFDLAFTPQMNEYAGRSSVQLKVLDWRPASV